MSESVSTADELPPLPEPALTFGSYTACQMRTYAAAALAAERERCAKVCEAIESQAWAAWKRAADPIEQGRSIGAQHCADSIAYTSGTSKQWLGGTVDGA